MGDFIHSWRADPSRSRLTGRRGFRVTETVTLRGLPGSSKFDRGWFHRECDADGFIRDRREEYRDG